MFCFVLFFKTKDAHKNKVFSQSLYSSVSYWSHRKFPSVVTIRNLFQQQQSNKQFELECLTIQWKERQCWQGALEGWVALHSPCPGQSADESLWTLWIEGFEGFHPSTPGLYWNTLEEPEQCLLSFSLKDYFIFNFVWCVYLSMDTSGGQKH